MTTWFLHPRNPRRVMTRTQNPLAKRKALPSNVALCSSLEMAVAVTALPDLLAACKELIALAPANYYEFKGDAEKYERARAAVAKAEGKS